MSRPLGHRELLGCLTPNQPELETENASLSHAKPMLLSLLPTYTGRTNQLGNSSQIGQLRTQLNTHMSSQISTQMGSQMNNRIRSQSDKGAAAAQSKRRSSILSPPMSPCQLSNKPVSKVLVDKSFLPSQLQFKIENFKDYKLTIEPWNNLNSSYKQSHLNFINQYQTSDESEYVPRRHKQRKLDFLDVDLESERMRTRRTPKPYKVESDDSELPSPKKRKRNISPNSPAQQQLLIDESIPDFSPDPSTTLPANNLKCLKIEWKGQPMDLSQDPNLDKLHPAEVVLASVLRLPALIYLDSKRRLFFEKVQRCKTGKQFRRTDAQKACRIDVNKASRLFAAFEKVGWLEDKHFAKYK